MKFSLGNPPLSNYFPIDIETFFYPIFVGNSVNTPIRKSLPDACGIQNVLSLFTRVPGLASYPHRLINHQGQLKHRKVSISLNRLALTFD